MNISLGGLNSNIEAIAILDDKEALVVRNGLIVFGIILKKYLY